LSPFKDLSWKPGSRATEFVRVKGMMSDKIYHPLTLRFLKAVGDQNTNAKVSLVNQKASVVCVDYYWDQYNWHTKMYLQSPYVV